MQLGTDFGPLTKVWSDLHKARDYNAPLNLQNTCNDLEKGMFVLGQVHIAGLFSRRKALLETFFKDRKKAADVVKRNQQVFSARGLPFW